MTGRQPGQSAAEDASGRAHGDVSTPRSTATATVTAAKPLPEPPESRRKRERSRNLRRGPRAPYNHRHGN